MLKPLLCILIGLGYASLSARLIWQDHALAESGVVALIEPLTEYEKTERKRRNQTRTTLTVDIYFRTQTGERVSSHKQVSGEQLRALFQPNATITYLPSNPKVTRIVGEPPSSWGHAGAGMLAAVVGIWWLRRRINAPVVRNR